MSIFWGPPQFAFQNVDTQNRPFEEHAFYAQWLVGGTYAVFCMLGKLVSKNPKDNSLRKLWPAVSDYIQKSGLCGEGEMAKINEKMHATEGHFTNSGSSAILFRNKAIAHNENSPRIEWPEIDEDIKLLCRIWSLITMWSSFGVLWPFRDGQVAFSGLESVFTDAEIRLLEKQRSLYVQRLEEWCTHSIADGQKVADISPFGKLSISIKTNRTAASGSESVKT